MKIATRVNAFRCFGWSRGVGLLAVGLGLLVAAFSATSHAQEAAPTPPGGVTVELNRLEPRGDACRTYVLIRNESDTAYRSLKMDLFVLDAGGVVAQRLAVEAAPLAARKTTIKLFDVPGVGCDRFGRVLLNDVIACDADGPRDDCLARISTATKSSVPFEK